MLFEVIIQNYSEWGNSLRTCMAPRFSVSWVGLEDPRSTELTPSFLKHQANDQGKEEFL